MRKQNGGKNRPTSSVVGPSSARDEAAPLRSASLLPHLRRLRALATELGLDLARRGHEVHFITYAMPFRLRGYTERVYFHEVDTSARYPLFEHFPYTLALASKQHEVALRVGLDVLHVHYAIPHATTAWLAREMLGPKHPVKVITTLHGTDITLVGQEESFAITKFSIEKSVRSPPSPPS